MLGIVRVRIGLSMALVALVGTGCASGGYASYEVVSPSVQDGVAQGGYAYADESAMDQTVAASAAPSPEAAYDEGPMPVSRGGSRAAPGSPPPPAQTASNGQAAGPPTPGDTPTDAERARELRIYTADLVMAVFDVRATQDTIVERIEALGGYLALRDDSILVVRVPAARFDDGVAAAEGAGQIIRRNLRAEDVTEQFRDLETRIRTLEAMRDRLETMLQRAANVQEALAVERELERVTIQLESLRGTLRYLGDRVAYSTITLRFQVLAPTEIPDAGHPRLLPFRWLRDLGLARLLEL